MRVGLIPYLKPLPEDSPERMDAIRAQSELVTEEFVRLIQTGTFRDGREDPTPFRLALTRILTKAAKLRDIFVRSPANWKVVFPKPLGIARRVDRRVMDVTDPIPFRSGSHRDGPSRDDGSSSTTRTPVVVRAADSTAPGDHEVWVVAVVTPSLMRYGEVDGSWRDGENGRRGVTVHKAKVVCLPILAEESDEEDGGNNVTTARQAGSQKAGTTEHPPPKDAKDAKDASAKNSKDARRGPKFMPGGSKPSKWAHNDASDSDDGGSSIFVRGDKKSGGDQRRPRGRPRKPISEWAAVKPASQRASSPPIKRRAASKDDAPGSKEPEPKKSAVVKKEDSQVVVKKEPVEVKKEVKKEVKEESDIKDEPQSSSFSKKRRRSSESASEEPSPKKTKSKRPAGETSTTTSDAPPPAQNTVTPTLSLSSNPAPSSNTSRGDSSEIVTARGRTTVASEEPGLFVEGTSAKVAPAQQPIFAAPAPTPTTTTVPALRTMPALPITTAVTAPSAPRLLLPSSEMGAEQRAARHERIRQRRFARAMATGRVVEVIDDDDKKKKKTSAKKGSIH
jgi:hypothetical protein